MTIQMLLQKYLPTKSAETRRNINAPSVGEMQPIWADPPQGPPSK
mgnify:CR=1 FL=1